MRIRLALAHKPETSQSTIHFPTLKICKHYWSREFFRHWPFRGCELHGHEGVVNEEGGEVVEVTASELAQTVGVGPGGVAAAPALHLLLAAARLLPGRLLHLDPPPLIGPPAYLLRFGLEPLGFVLRLFCQLALGLFRLLKALFRLLLLLFDAPLCLLLKPLPLCLLRFLLLFPLCLLL